VVGMPAAIGWLVGRLWLDTRSK